MNWPYLRHGDIAGILLMAVVLAVIASVLLFLPLREHNFGFGPEWQCARMEQGDPICVRVIGKDEAGNLPP